jgi:hypothetical protein
MVEKGGLIVAAVGTVAATLGEILAVRALMRREHDKTRQKVDAAAAAAVQALDRAERDAAAAPATPAAAATAATEQEEVVAVVEAAAAAAEHEAVAADNVTAPRTSAGAEAAAAAGVEQDGSCGWKWDEGAAGSDAASPELIGSEGVDGGAAVLNVTPSSDKQQH